MQLLPSSLERCLHNIPGVIQIMFPVFYSTIICAFTAAMGCCTYSPTQFPHHTKPVHFNSLCNLLHYLYASSVRSGIGKCQLTNAISQSITLSKEKSFIFHMNYLRTTILLHSPPIQPSALTYWHPIHLPFM